MANTQQLDFERFKSLSSGAIAGLEDVMVAARRATETCPEIAAQVGSEKLTRTTSQFVAVTEGLQGTLESIKQAAEEVIRTYEKINNAVN
jgi:uncharacterized protein with von Willebrand factor type A (vWA) domain